MRTKFILLLSFLLITACGPRMIYPNLDWLIPWYVEDYLSLDANQSSALKARLDRHLQWHCRTQLPQYAVFLRKLHRDFENPNHPISEGRLADHYLELKEYWRNLVRQIGPDIADILITANDDQINELFKNLEKENHKLKNKYVDRSQEKLVRDRYDMMIQRLGYWLGSLTEAQEDTVEKWSARIIPTGVQWLEHRRRVQGEFRRLLNQRTRNPEFGPAFTNLLLSLENMRTRVYQTQIEENRKLTFTLMARLDSSLSPGQRNHLLNRFESLAKDFERLSCELPPPA